MRLGAEGARTERRRRGRGGSLDGGCLSSWQDREEEKGRGGSLDGGCLSSWQDREEEEKGRGGSLDRLVGRTGLLCWCRSPSMERRG